MISAALPFAESDGHRLASVGIVHRLHRRIAGPLGNSHPDGKVRLKFIHPGLDLVLLDGCPDIGRPVLVQLMRILDEEHFVGIDLITVAGLRTNRDGVALAIQFEHRHHLMQMRGVRRGIGDHILDFQLLDGQQQSGLMRKIRAVARPVVRVVGKAVTFPDPHRLLGKLFGGLQIIGIEFLGNDVIVRIQGRRLLSGFLWPCWRAAHTQHSRREELPRQSRLPAPTGFSASLLRSLGCCPEHRSHPGV